MSINEKCYKILSNEIKDEQIYCNLIESILPHLTTIKINNLISLISFNLKLILQYWNKGNININNKWSFSCINLSTTLCSLISNNKNNNNENNENINENINENDETKYYKLIGYVLGRAFSMGNVILFYLFYSILFFLLYILFLLYFLIFFT